MINYYGVSTHNLKNIDFSIEEKSIVLLRGCSGSGKSSLAIDTIYRVSDDELCQLTNRACPQSHYEVASYSGIIPSICLQQENYNVNPRSTIGTYFCLNQFLGNVFSHECRLSRATLNFNNPDYACPCCKGLGSVLEPSVIDSIDESKSIVKKPFRIWNVKDSDLYNQLLLAYCNENKIAVDVPFHDLSDKTRSLLINAVSNEKYKIAYRSAGIKRTKTLKFKGVVPFLDDIVCSGEIPGVYRNFIRQGVCPECGGGRLSPSFNQYKVFGRSLLEYYTMEFNELYAFLKAKAHLHGQSYVANQFSPLINFIESAVRMNLGYLNLNRSIPSLSGGELQRLSISKASISQFNGFLYVFDEPTSALHPSEWQAIVRSVKEIRSRGNTIVVIDHSPSLESVADSVVYLGPASGDGGGEIVQPYGMSFSGFSNRVHVPFFVPTGQVVIHKASYNNVRIEDEKIKLGTLVGICGVSGSGKTSFARHILPHAIPGVCYVNQDPIRGNSYSIVATALDVLKDIIRFFAQETKTQLSNFDFVHAGRGRCNVCAGTGRVVEKSAHFVTDVLCPDCHGARYSKATLRIRWKGMTISDFLNKSIDDILTLLPEKMLAKKRLSIASEAGLGYLRLMQKTETLSGGEAQRVKIVSHIMHTNKAHAFALDEPFRGVDSRNAEKLMELICRQVANGNSVFLIEHNPEVLSCCSYLLEFGPGSGMKGGRLIYNGEKKKIGECKISLTRQYLT